MLNEERQQEIHEYETEIKKAVGEQVSAYTEKLKWLQNTWRAKIKGDHGNSPQSRLVADIVLHNATPVNTALIADNLEYFQAHAGIQTNHKGKTIYNPELHLKRACLLGSRRIGEFLLFNELSSNYTDPTYNYVLGYVCESMNEEWMKDIANTMEQAHLSMPQSVYSAPYRIIFMIEEIFKLGENPFKKYDLASTDNKPKPF